MTSQFRRRVGDALVSVGVLAIVLGVLVSVDARVRERLETVVTTGAPDLGVPGAWGNVGYVLFDAARTQSIDHAPLMIFVVCATVLLLFMWRT
jgi:hypothetical protein